MERLRLKIKRITVPVDTAMGDWRIDANGRSVEEIHGEAEIKY